MARFNTDNAALLVIDVQGKLAQRMFEKDILLKNCSSLIKAAHILTLPILLTEQAPHKIGATIEEIASLLRTKPIEKMAFSCALEPVFMKTLRQTQRQELIVCGIEAHVCVYQSVCDLIEQQFDVQVVADAVSSRHENDRRLALSRMREAGASLTSTEMIITELLGGALHPRFKDVMALIK
jgi:nicotinamidase-related amidase